MKLPKIKMTRIRKLRIAEFVSIAVYAIGVGLYTGTAHEEGYDKGFKAGAEAMQDAYELQKEADELAKKYKEDKK